MMIMSRERASLDPAARLTARTKERFKALGKREKAHRAMQFLGSLSSLDEVDVEVVERKLSSIDWTEVRWALTALTCLARCGWTPERVLPTLIELLKNGRANATRAAALGTLVESVRGETLVTVLREALSDFSDEVRGSAVRAIDLHQLQNEPTIRAALEALLVNETDDYVRGIAEQTISSR